MRNIRLILLLVCGILVRIYGQDGEEPEEGGIREIVINVEPKNCEPLPGDLGRVHAAFIDPTPLSIPGEFSVNLNFSILEDLTETVDMKIEVLKKIPLMFGMVSWLRVPCIRAGRLTFGSCLVKDTCTHTSFNSKLCLRPGTKPEDRDYVECGCPTFKKGTYYLKPFEYNFPKIPAAAPNYLLEGELYVKLEWISGDKRLNCVETPVFVKARSENKEKIQAIDYN